MCAVAQAVQFWCFAKRLWRLGQHDECAHLQIARARDRLAATRLLDSSATGSCSKGRLGHDLRTGSRCVLC
jgi:hypothetical protein